MLDVSDILYQHGYFGLFEEMVDWCSQNVGTLISMQGATCIGQGWCASITRKRDGENSGLVWFFEFVNDLDELQFKLIWPDAKYISSESTYSVM